MTDAWDDETKGAAGVTADEAVPGSFDDKSLEIDLATVLRDSKEIARRELASSAQTAVPPMSTPRGDLVVFEPTPVGLAKSLGALGYPVRGTTTGVDAMSYVAERPPAALVCGPVQDGERRRLLAAAMKLRFPSVPILYVSSHAGKDDAIAGALREGARAVLAWPLPEAAAVARVLRPYVSASAAPALAAPRPITMVAIPIAGDDEGFDDARTEVAPSVAKARLTAAASARLQLSTAEGATIVDDEEPAGPMPPARGPAEAATRIVKAPPALRSGELGDLLNAISPFLWGLEDTARYVERKAEEGDPRALSHAKTLRLLASLLEQLEKRITDLGA